MKLPQNMNCVQCAQINKCQSTNPHNENEEDEKNPYLSVHENEMDEFACTDQY